MGVAFRLGERLRATAVNSPERTGYARSGSWSLVVTAPGLLETPAGKVALVTAMQIQPSTAPPAKIVEQDRLEWMASGKWLGTAPPTPTDFDFLRSFARGAGAAQPDQLTELTPGGYYWMWGHAGSTLAPPRPAPVHPHSRRPT